MSQNEPISFLPTQKLQGTVKVPGDKSLSHRSLMISAQLLGPCHIYGLLEGEDVMNTLFSLRKLGVKIIQNHDHWTVQGNGPLSLQAPDDILDLGNAGTGARLLMGLVSSHPFKCFFTGDKSLRSRPMGRIFKPLEQMGASFLSSEGNKLPCAVIGSELMPTTYKLPIPSAQVKSAILLAGLNTAGTTTVIEETPTRDHTERMLNFFGITCETVKNEDGYHISLNGQQKVSYQERTLTIPGDPSSAAFPIVAALITSESEVVVENICMNPARIGLFETLRKMGATIEFRNERSEAGEEVADIAVSHSHLKGITVPADVAPSMIDEYPILSIAACFAEGTTRMEGLTELRHKESDRLQAMHDGLKNCGADIAIEGDSLVITGSPEKNLTGGVTLDSQMDHRIAMSFLIAGLRSDNPVEVTGREAIATSFPGFISLMRQLGVTTSTLPIATMGSHADHGKGAPLILAIDGPAASGKGTLGRRLAEKLGLVYLDTGSLYRAVGMKLVYGNKNANDVKAALEAAASIQLHDLNNPRLRQERVGQAASIVSAIPQVRELLLEFQRRIAHSPQGAVLDGRDIGTVVCPEATLKLFVTANIETRAQRRHRELQGQGITVLYESVLRELEQRDKRDKNRAKAPLRAAEDATTIDTSNLSADEVFEKAYNLITELEAAA